MAVVNLPVTKDTYVSGGGGQQNYNFGSSSGMSYRYTEVPYYTYTPFMEFNLSAIPAGAIINGATLYFYAESIAGQQINAIIVVVDRAWDEYGLTYNNASWQSPSNAPAGIQVPITPSTPAGWIGTNITAFVRGWLNGSFPNYGLRIGASTSKDQLFSIRSKEYQSGYGAYIQVDYTPPNSSPNAPNLSTPVNGGWYNTGSPLVSWGFSDPDAGNYQGNAAVHIFEHYSNSVVRDTGWAFGGAQSWYINPPLPDGTYRYRVITQDQSGAAGPWSGEPYFYVDTTPPTVTITSPTSNAVLATRTPTISWSFSDNMTGQQAYLLEIVNASYTAVLWSSDWVADENARSRVTPDLGEGRFCARMTARDLAGNYRSLEITNTWYTVDVTTPTTSNHSFSGYTFGQATNASSGTIRLNWVYNDATEQTAYHIAGSNTSWASWTYDSGEIYNANKFHDINFSGLAEGYWYFALYVRDSAGNWSGPAGGYEIRIDRTLPTIGGITPLAYTNQATKRMELTGVADSSSDIQKVDAYILNLAGNAWSGPYSSINAGSGKWYYDFNAAYEGQGSHTVRFWVYDNAGNGTHIDSVIVYDTSNPVIGSGDGDRYSNQNSGSIRHTVSNVSDATSGVVNVTFQFRKSPDNGATWDAWGSVYNGTQDGTSWYYDVPISGDGYYEIAVMAYDRANNASGYYYMHTTVDSVLANDPNPKVIYQQTTATFTWDAFSDPNPSSGRKSTDFYLYEWDGTSIGAVFHMGNDIGNVTTYTQTGLKAGQRYRYTVTYHDKAGNESGYTYKEFITKKQIGARKIHKAGADITLPIYALDSGVLGSKSYRIACGSGVVGCYELVDPSDPNASSERINTPQGVKALSK